MSVTIPLVRNLSSNKVLIRYSSTLTLIIPRKLLEITKSSKPVIVPVYEGYTRRGGILYTVLGAGKFQFETSNAGLYYAENTGEETQFAGVPLNMYRVTEPSDKLPDWITGEKARIQVLQVLKSERIINYRAINGREYSLIMLPRTIIGKVIDGTYYTSRVAIVVMLKYYDVKPGELMDCYYLYSKAGRANYMNDYTSHQANIYLATPD